ncbi:MAG: hypothetical protein JEZ03_04805 [Bacteroidales bacterium]|nr:hypothetical protein [Bacteroidales bacterium]
MENYFSNIKLSEIIVKWKWHMAIILVISAIAGGAGSYLLEEKYESKAVIYPSNISEYSDESVTEQMIQWLNSQDIHDSIIKNFNLSHHYELDSNYKYFKTTMEYFYGQNVSIKKTQYESIEIKVQDKDPEIAKEMVDAILHYVDLKIQGIQQSKFEEVVRNAKFIVDQSMKDIRENESELQKLSSEFGIIHYESQAEAVAKGMLGTVEGMGSQGVNRKELNTLYKNLQAKGSEWLTRYKAIEPMFESHEALLEEYYRAYYYSNREYTYVNLVSAPFASDKKAYPVRWLIVFYSVMATLFISLLVIAIIEAINNMKANKA